MLRKSIVMKGRRCCSINASLIGLTRRWLKGVIQNCEIGNPIDRGDFAVLDRKSSDQEHLSMWGDDDSYQTVHQDGPCSLSLSTLSCQDHCVCLLDFLCPGKADFGKLCCP